MPESVNPLWITLVISIGPQVVSAFGGYLVSRKARITDTRSDEATVLKLATDRAAYWKTYIDTFPDDMGIRGRALKDMERTSQELERISADPQDTLALVSAMPSIRASKWKYLSFWYHSPKNIAASYFLWLVVGFIIYLTGFSSKTTANVSPWLIGVLRFIWFSDAVVGGYVAVHGLWSLMQISQIRNLIAKRAQSEKIPT